jgi:flagellar biosynthesis/type III secretory pathway protein FliH
MATDRQLLAEMQEEKEAKLAEATKRTEENAKKTPEERLFAAKEQCRQAGQRLCPRIAGQIDRETGKLIDQFAEELTGLEKEVSKIVWSEFLSELDIAVAERKILK